MLCTANGRCPRHLLDPAAADCGHLSREEIQELETIDEGSYAPDLLHGLLAVAAQIRELTHDLGAERAAHLATKRALERARPEAVAALLRQGAAPGAATAERDACLAVVSTIAIVPGESPEAMRRRIWDAIDGRPKAPDESAVMELHREMGRLRKLAEAERALRLAERNTRNVASFGMDTRSAEHDECDARNELRAMGGEP